MQEGKIIIQLYRSENKIAIKAKAILLSTFLNAVHMSIGINNQPTS
ncbi:MAG: hypothetical protein GX638_02150 [Crenarchaeota archaeon]|nr:hypothetical protein [Thermoproteota archaeon]